MTDEISKVDNPWRKFIENCINGDNYFRGSEYRELLADLDRGYQAEAQVATLARQLAEAKAANELLRDRCRDHARLIDDFAARSEQAESQLAEATRRLGEVEGLVGKWRECAEDNAAKGELIQAGKAVAYTDCADELEAALKEPK